MAISICRATTRLIHTQHRQAGERHPRAAAAADGGDEVHRGADRADAAHQQRERPVVGGVAEGEGFRGERSVREPADIGRRAAAVEPFGAEHAEVEEQRPEERQPERERVQPRERHVAGADHERHQVVRESEDDRHADEEDHRRAVHRHQAVEDLGRDDGVARDRQLDAHGRGLEPGDQEEDQARGDVHEPEPLVVDAGDPAVQRGEHQRSVTR